VYHERLEQKTHRQNRVRREKGEKKTIEEKKTEKIRE